MNRIGPLILAIAAGASAAGPAHAQEAAATAAPVDEGGTTATPVEVRPPVAARTGFQAALRAAWMAPFGNASADASDSMGNIFSPVGSLFVDLGWKFWRKVFLGAYVGLGFGGAAGGADRACRQAAAACGTTYFGLGLEVQYAFRPDAFMNPWLGYGIGIESTSFYYSDSYSVYVSGFEFGHLSAGLDLRLSRTFGLGPVLDLSLAQYSGVGSIEHGETSSGTLKHQALHEWLLVGARLVLFP
jgi:hypothetical protein